MNHYLKILEILFLVPTLLFAFYLASLTVLALLANQRGHLKSARKTRTFCILVPAHNEELVIRNTLSSLKNLAYPADMFDIIVIADNCTDKTAKLAGQNGAKVFERIDDVNRGKGQALRWALDILAKKKKKYDAFIIVDADTVASKNMLMVMNSYLENGAECIQCSTLVIPQPGAWSPEMTRIGFILHNYVRPLGKKVLGLSMGLNGNGMCFSADLISRMPWTSYSRVEDLEHALELILQGVKVRFAPETSVHAIMPTDPKSAESQRRRWEIARFSIIRRYSLRLLVASVTRFSPSVFDMFLELVTPAFVNLFLFTAAATAVNAAAMLSASHAFTFFTLLYGTALLLEIFHVIAGLAAAGADKSAYVALMKAPKYAAWKLRLYFNTVLKGDDKAWLRTERDDRLVSRN